MKKIKTLQKIFSGFLWEEKDYKEINSDFMKSATIAYTLK